MKKVLMVVLALSILGVTQEKKKDAPKEFNPKVSLEEIKSLRDAQALSLFSRAQLAETKLVVIQIQSQLSVRERAFQLAIDAVCKAHGLERKDCVVDDTKWTVEKAAPIKEEKK